MNNFYLARWLKNPHLQTVGSVLVPRAMKVFPSKNRLFQLSDGSQLVAECSWQVQKKAAPTVIILPGLNGSTVSSYVRGTAAKAFGKGLNVVRLNLRNGGGSEKYSKTLMHAGESDDLWSVIDELIAVDGLAKIGLIGFSFGGNIALKAIGEWGIDVPRQVIGAVGISPLIDLAATADSIDNRAPAIYRWQLLRGLKSSLRKRAGLFPGQYDIQGLRAVKKFRDYDNFTASYNGFRNADDYYAQVSSRRLLPKITIPTLLIHADDDAVIPMDSFSAITNSSISLFATRGGGHGGFIGQKRNGDSDLHWAENRAVEFIVQQTIYLQ
jgi:predicted alpha/beta-fold hydrolase